MEQLVQNATKFIKEVFQNDFSGHDFFHSMRVYRTAVNIAEAEHADLEVVALAALLHDADDRKFSPTTAEKKENAVAFMRGQNVPEAEICRYVRSLTRYPSRGRIPSGRPRRRGNACRMLTDWMPSVRSALPAHLPMAEAITAPSTIRNCRHGRR